MALLFRFCNVGYNTIMRKYIHFSLMQVDSDLRKQASEVWYGGRLYRYLRTMHKVLFIDQQKR
jgi:hypothetical protein